MASKSLPFRLLNTLGFIVCIIALLCTMNMNKPFQAASPLILTTRGLAFTCIGIYIIAIIRDPLASGQQFYNFIHLVIASLGVLITGSHLWIQAVPTDINPEFLQQCQLSIREFIAINPVLLDSWQKLAGSIINCPTEASIISDNNTAIFVLLFFIIIFLYNWKLLTLDYSSDGIFYN